MKLINFETPLPQFDPARAAELLATLSARELQTLKLVAFGYTNKEIAHDLGLSVKTVEAHKWNGMRKLQFRTRRSLVRLAVNVDWFAELRAPAAQGDAADQPKVASR